MIRIIELRQRKEDDSITFKRIKNSIRGSAIFEMLIFACIIIFILLPLFAYCYERYVVYLKLNVIKDAVDMSILSSYNAINSEILSGSSVDICIQKAQHNFRELMSSNLNLDSELKPESKSVIDGQVKIKDIIFYPHSSKAYVQCELFFPIKPCFFGNIIRLITGKELFNITFKETVEIPVNK